MLGRPFLSGHTKRDAQTATIIHQAAQKMKRLRPNRTSGLIVGSIVHDVLWEQRRADVAKKSRLVKQRMYTSLHGSLLDGKRSGSDM